MNPQNSNKLPNDTLSEVNNKVTCNTNIKDEIDEETENWETEHWIIISGELFKLLNRSKVD